MTGHVSVGSEVGARIREYVAYFSFSSFRPLLAYHFTLIVMAFFSVIIHNKLQAE